MAKGIILLALAPVVVAGSEALLDRAGSAQPHITFTYQDQANESVLNGKRALRPNESTNGAAGDERTPEFLLSLIEGLSASLTRITAIGEKAIWRMNKAAMREEKEGALMEDVAQRKAEAARKMEEEASLRKAEVARKEEQEAAWVKYKDAWKKENEALSATDNAWRKANEASWKKEEDALKELMDKIRKEKKAWRQKEREWKEKKAKTIEEAAWEKLKFVREKEMSEWETKVSGWEEDKLKLEDDVAFLKMRAAEKEVAKYLPEFEKLKRDGVTLDKYQDVLDLDPLIIEMFARFKDTTFLLYHYGPRYTKYLYFKIFLLEGLHSLKWTPFFRFRPNST